MRSRNKELLELLDTSGAELFALLTRLTLREDIAEELFGQIELPSGVEPIEQMGPFQYRLTGNLAIRDWEETFGIDLVETRLCTIGGLVTALLGKIPKSGDVAHLKNLKFTVEKVQKHRIETMILTFEPLAKNGQ